MNEQSSGYDQEEIGILNLYTTKTETTSLKVSIVNDKTVDIRVWIETPKYSGPTKKGIRLSLLNDTWLEFKELMARVDKKRKELVT